MLSFLKAHFNYGKSRTWFWQTCQVEMLVHETYKVRLYRQQKKIELKEKSFSHRDQKRLLQVETTLEKTTLVQDYFRSRLLQEDYFRITTLTETALDLHPIISMLLRCESDFSPMSHFLPDFSVDLKIYMYIIS